MNTDLKRAAEVVLKSHDNSPLVTAMCRRDLWEALRAELQQEDPKVEVPLDAEHEKADRLRENLNAIYEKTFKELRVLLGLQAEPIECCTIPGKLQEILASRADPQEGRELREYSATCPCEPCVKHREVLGTKEGE